MGRTPRLRPRDHSEDWPTEPCDDPVAEVARLFVVNLIAVSDRDGIRAVGRACGISHSTLSRIIAGETWADFTTLARLEAGTGTQMWPGATGTD